MNEAMRSCESEGINPEYARARDARRKFNAFLAEITQDAVESGNKTVTAWWVEEMERLKARHAREFES